MNDPGENVKKEKPAALAAVIGAARQQPWVLMAVANDRQVRCIQNRQRPGVWNLRAA